MKIRLICKECRRLLKVPERAMGRRIICPACNAMFRGDPSLVRVKASTRKQAGSPSDPASDPGRAGVGFDVASPVHEHLPVRDAGEHLQGLDFSPDIPLREEAESVPGQDLAAEAAVVEGHHDDPVLDFLSVHFGGSDTELPPETPSPERWEHTGQEKVSFQELFEAQEQDLPGTEEAEAQAQEEDAVQNVQSEAGDPSSALAEGEESGSPTLPLSTAEHEDAAFHFLNMDLSSPPSMPPAAAEEEGTEVFQPGDNAASTYTEDDAGSELEVLESVESLDIEPEVLAVEAFAPEEADSPVLIEPAEPEHSEKPEVRSEEDAAFDFLNMGLDQPHSAEAHEKPVQEAPGMDPQGMTEELAMESSNVDAGLSMPTLDTEEPEAVEPEVLEPEVVEEAVEPEVVVEPEVLEPEVVEPEVLEPEAVETLDEEPAVLQSEELFTYDEPSSVEVVDEVEDAPPLPSRGKTRPRPPALDDEDKPSPGRRRQSTKKKGGGLIIALVVAGVALAMVGCGGVAVYLGFFTQ